MLEDVESFKVGEDGSHKRRRVPEKPLYEGWQLYNAKFDDHLTKWTQSELTPEKLTQDVLATAKELRTRSSGVREMLPDFVKEKVPELLAGIFALYAILRSGTAYSSVGTQSGTMIETGMLRPQELGPETGLRCPSTGSRRFSQGSR